MAEASTTDIILPGIEPQKTPQKLEGAAKLLHALYNTPAQLTPVSEIDIITQQAHRPRLDEKLKYIVLYSPIQYGILFEVDPAALKEITTE
jgi:hypothetical protein